LRTEWGLCRAFPYNAGLYAELIPNRAVKDPGRLPHCGLVESAPIKCTLTVDKTTGPHPR
jgi:hypothetical protein